MSSLNISNLQARRFILRQQCLWPPRSLAGKAGIMEFIRRVGCIQFDPLNVVGRNPDLVLQSRISGYRPEMLEELLYRDRELLDGWDKMAAIYAVADRPCFIHRQRENAERSPWNNDDHLKEVVPQVRAEIEARGPLSSIDLAHDRKVNWSWGPTRAAKVALEDMFYRGELIIHHKAGTRKYYDLAARHLPADIMEAPDPHATDEDYRDWHIRRRIRGIGLAWNRGGMMWHGANYTGHGTKVRTAALERLVGRGEALEFSIEGSNYTFYIDAHDREMLEAAASPEIPEPKAAVIAPLDNLLWERELVKMLFGFDYTWEVYKPVKDRKFGYYVLPVLYGDRFIARFEPGRDKKTGALEIKNWWWEPGVTPAPDMETALEECFRCFLDYLGLEKIKAKKSLVTREKLRWLPRGRR